MRLHCRARVLGLQTQAIGRVTTCAVSPAARRDSVLLWNQEDEPIDSRDYLVLASTRPIGGWHLDCPAVQLPPDLGYLAAGDVLAVQPSGSVRVLYRKGSKHNFFLVTERCNSYCLMCSQPPRAVDDSGRLREHLRVLALIDPSTEQLGITGGEPTLLRDGLLELIRAFKIKLPNTALHVLTNGRMFYYRKFAEQLAAVCHPNITLGIPLYSDIDSTHDYVVQAKGAFDETLVGIHNLGRFDVPIEIRVVVHRETWRRLPQLAGFITRNIPFAVHVALMGLETIGFAVANRDRLWIDPYDYRDELREAVGILHLSGMSVSLYNHQLCVVDHRIWPFARKSISDWKNVYLDECGPCILRNKCGGFFQSNEHLHSAHIRPVEH